MAETARSALLSPSRRGSGLSITSPCVRVRTPAKRQAGLESKHADQAPSPCTPFASKRQSFPFSARPITPFKDECMASGAAVHDDGGPRRWVLDDFEIGKPLGRGKFGNVYAAKEKESGVVVALKVMSKSPILAEGAERNLQREVVLHSRLIHPNILGQRGYFHNPKSCFIILEYATGGELFGELQKHQGGLPERAAAVYLTQLLSAVHHLQSCCVIHRDIKPENCLLSGGSQACLKLADFGGAVHAPPPLFNVRTTLCGTPEYLAPEVLAGKGYGQEVDVWASGVLLHELFFGCTPFKDVDADRTYARIAAFDHLDLIPRARNLSLDAQRLLTALLNPTPRLRPSPSAAAGFPWLHAHKR